MSRTARMILAFLAKRMNEVMDMMVMCLEVESSVFWSLESVRNDESRNKIGLVGDEGGGIHLAGTVLYVFLPLFCQPSHDLPFNSLALI